MSKSREKHAHADLIAAHVKLKIAEEMVAWALSGESAKVLPQAEVRDIVSRIVKLQRLAFNAAYFPKGN